MKEKESIFSYLEHVDTSVTCTLCGVMVSADDWSMSRHSDWHTGITKQKK